MGSNKKELSKTFKKLSKNKNHKKIIVDFSDLNKLEREMGKNQKSDGKSHHQSRAVYYPFQSGHIGRVGSLQ